MSRILIWSPNYAPELTGIPPLVTDAAEYFAERGHDIEVVTAMPNYPERLIRTAYRGAIWSSERIGRIDVHRSWLRVRPGERFADKMLYEATFTAVSLPRVARRIRRADVVICVVPTLTSAAAAAALRRLTGSSARLVVWVQDLVLRAGSCVVGTSRLCNSVLRAAGAFERAAFAGADCVVACSPDFSASLVARGVNPNSLTVLPNWVDTDAIRPQQLNGRNGRTRFLYSGNIGYTQGLETLLAATRIVGDVAEVRVVGDGNQAAHIRELAEHVPNVEVGAPVPKEEFPGLLATADVDVVLQRRLGAGANFPSKIATYLASGRPVLAAIEPTTAAARMLTRSGGALLVPPEAPEELAAAMQRLHEDAELRYRLGRCGRLFAESALSKAHLLPKFEAAVLAAPK